MIYLLLVFVFLFIMVGLLIFFERYAKHCVENNDELNRHSRWLHRAGMNETYHIINRRWKVKF